VYVVTTGVSPSTGSAKVDSTRRTRPSAPMKAVAVNRPGRSNETESPLPARAPPRIAALSTPCGVIHSWCIRSVTKRGPGVAVVPAWFQAMSPLTNWSLRCCPESG
jgi:hypothetical protein